MSTKIKLFITTMALMVLSHQAAAEPFVVIYSDTIFIDGFPPEGLNADEKVTTAIVMDNGGNSTINQTWNASDVQCMIFWFNDSQDIYVAIDYTSNGFTSSDGNFSTNELGALTSAPSEWVDIDTNEILAPYTQNIPVDVPFRGWYLNGGNDVLLWYRSSRFYSIGFNNVEDNIVPTAWTSPATAGELCANPESPPGQDEEYESVPTFSGWGLAVLSILMLLASVFFLRRQHFDAK